MTAREHLLNILESIHTEAVVVDASEVSDAGRIGINERPTHVVLDCEGEVMGRGLDEDSAVADAIMRTIQHQEHAIDEYQAVVGNYRAARLALEKLA